MVSRNPDDRARRLLDARNAAARRRYAARRAALRSFECGECGKKFGAVFLESKCPVCKSQVKRVRIKGEPPNTGMKWVTVPGTERMTLVADDPTRRKKKGPGTGETERSSPSGMRSVGGKRFCEHGVPETGNCSRVGCWNNMVDPAPEPKPILRIPTLRAVVDAAAADIEREKRERVKTRRARTRAEQKRKPKTPEPPPLTGRAPKAYDGEEV